ncbi:aldolase [bacterium]|jgi:4-hydroxy 2-oxovalerate aldolase|nr:aldolase [bacterium]
MILDCTLRDGGYYVDWDFDESTVRRYLSAIAIAKIDVIEIGFRFLSSKSFFGAFAYSTDEYLRSINIPRDVPIAVMVNASELINNEECGVRDVINQLFTRKEQSPVSIVRVAVHIDDISSSYDIVDELNSLGYRVFLNLMQIDSVEDDEIVKLSSLVESWKLVEVLYFADSFGSMDLDRVEKIVECILTAWSGSIGIHAHNNKGLALPNTLRARECGVEYLDSTICGMGRGAGNTKTEYLLTEIIQIDGPVYFPDAIFPLALQEFGALQKKYEWGESIYYFLSATYGIHPTYIQEMLSGELYDTGQILSAINFLRESNVPFYSFEKMLSALVGVEGDSSGGWSASGWAKNRDVLILASGPELNNNIKVVIDYIKNKNPVVLCLNVNELIPKNCITAYVACHETRILIESDRYNELNVPIILPLNRIPESIRNVLDKAKIFDFGMAIKKNEFEIKNNDCILSSALSLFYAISVATAANANRILIAGADGYEINDPRYKEISDLFDKYDVLDNAISVYSITKTKYPIKQRSVYDPML